MGTLFDVVVGFSLEALAFIFWITMGILLGILLTTRVKWLKDKIFLGSSIAGVIVCLMVGDYRAFLFWAIIFILIFLLTASPVVESVTKRLSWIRSFTYYGICALIVCTVFIMMRGVIFQDVPYQMWYQ